MTINVGSVNDLQKQFCIRTKMLIIIASINYKLDKVYNFVLKSPDEQTSLYNNNDNKNNNNNNKNCTFSPNQSALTSILILDYNYRGIPGNSEISRFSERRTSRVINSRGVSAAESVSVFGVESIVLRSRVCASLRVRGASRAPTAGRTETRCFRLRRVYYFPRWMEEERSNSDRQ